MIQPDELKSDAPLLWSAGRGTDVWALLSACKDGDLAAVTALVERDPSLVRCHFAYRKPLYFAVRENRLDVARFLLERDPDPMNLWVHDNPYEIVRDRGYAEMERLLVTMLESKHNASERGEAAAAAIRAHALPELLRLLDAEPALLHLGDKGSSQPIHWATMTRQPDVIDALLARGADINARRMDGARPIHLSNGDYNYRGWRDVAKSWPTSPADVLAHLIARGARVDLNTAAHMGDIARVRALLEEDPSRANRESDHGGYYLGAGTPLKNAAATGRMDIVRLLLEYGADPNLPEEQIAPKGHALYAAVYNRHYDIAKLLLQKGAFPNPPVESSADALWIAVKNNDRNMEALLRSFGAVPGVDLHDRRPTDDDGPNWLLITPLHHRARDGNVRKAKKLLARGDDVHARDEDLSSTPLAWAARSGQLKMMKLLLECGATVQHPDDAPWATPLAWATRRGQVKAAELLRRHGALA